jgi:hypothetical protein
MIVCFTAYPSILLAGRDDRDLPIYASPDQRPSDHAAMVSDALTGWSTGCIQYGVLATVGYAVWRGVRPVAKSKV